MPPATRPAARKPQKQKSPRALFPDPRRATEDGIVAVGGTLEPPILLEAYRSGIFPWPISAELPLVWFSPPERAVLVFEELHVPRSLRAEQRRAPFRFTIDRAFEEVIHACASQRRPGQPGTWITPAMIEAYVEFHRQGYAHSVEAWNGTKLVGGLYGVAVEGCFAGESMFYRESQASKLALLHLVEHLSARGLDWMDIQVMTPHLEALGARVISRDAFLKMLARTRTRSRAKPRKLF